jgi:hypothetical protein
MARDLLSGKVYAGRDAAKIYDAALPGMVADGSINEEIQKRVIDDTRRFLGMKESVSPDRVSVFLPFTKSTLTSKLKVGKPAP